MSLSFLILALLTLGGAVAAMTLHRLVHSVLALTMALAGLAGLYLNLGAQFVGLAQILVYVGAVAILIVFAVLLTRGAETGSQAEPGRRLRFSPLAGGIATTAVVFVVLAWAVLHSAALSGPQVSAPQVTMQQIGDTLMRRYILPLEVMGLMLTAALIGAVILALQEKPDAQ
jgi:NADH:ubiquinone oxidoreductase subunit 6 (subunit J)